MSPLSCVALEKESLSWASFLIRNTQGGLQRFLRLFLLSNFNYGGNTAGLVCVLHTLPGPRRGRFPFLLFHCLDWVSLDRFPLWFSFALSVRKKRFHGPPACWGCPWGSCDLCLLPSPSQKLAEKEVAGALSEEGDWLDAGLQAIHT